MNRFQLANRFFDFWREFNTESHWTFPELPASDILRSRERNICDVDHDEFVRAKWMWARRPALMKQDVERASPAADPVRA